MMTLRRKERNKPVNNNKNEAILVFSMELTNCHRQISNNSLLLFIHCDADKITYTQQHVKHNDILKSTPSYHLYRSDSIHP